MFMTYVGVFGVMRVRCRIPFFPQGTYSLAQYLRAWLAFSVEQFFVVWEC